MKVLLTGGAGFIGSAVAYACLDRGIDVVVLDDLSTGRDGVPPGASMYVGDIADGAVIDRIVADHPEIAVVIHCAAKTIVAESMSDPLDYYATNVGKTALMLEALRTRGIQRVVFSSSASIYRADDGSGLDEDAPLLPSSPYAASKMIGERMLADASHAGQTRALALRYFNPIGSDPLLRTGLRDEAPTHVVGRLIHAWEVGETFTITGVDWPTSDGSGVRDFVHVWDLALAHVRAIEVFDEVVTAAMPFRALNIGVGVPMTVRQLTGIFDRVVGGGMEVREGARRPGDVAGGYAAVDRARDLLGWSATRTVEEGIRDALAWRRLLMSGARP
ncbi:UDP-glucose 4-epimerase GalE [Microbacterium sp. CJ88]|uniref:UDP-glucose 4-epimerase GalE n=1 Tax=Microbacterium sp. CJ88 TaxID=3445672 RepID=UPI003F660957